MCTWVSYQVAALHLRVALCHVALNLLQSAVKIFITPYHADMFDLGEEEQEWVFFFWSCACCEGCCTDLDDSKWSDLEISDLKRCILCLSGK